jgi:micrococcal nuclease
MQRSKSSRMRHKTMLVRVLLACLLGISGPAGARAGDTPRLSGVVVGVADGDTIDVRLVSGMIRVRLHGVDAPERDQPYGMASRRELSRLVFGRDVELEPVEQDRYDRLVARVWLGDTDVNAELLELGAAWVYRRYAREASDCVREQAARDRGRGLWRLPAEQWIAPWEWRQRGTRRGPFTDFSGQTVAECVASLGP